MMFQFAPRATAQVSIGIGLPSASIGINVPLYPDLVPVPGYPVYYDPRLHSNLFFYDGLYWVYAEDNWYASSWYNGPWDLISPEICRISYCACRCVSIVGLPNIFGQGSRRTAPLGRALGA
jgi:hypothetical protein